jgi:hypothetical protein
VPTFNEWHYRNKNEIDERIYTYPRDQCHFPFFWCFHDIKIYTAKLQQKTAQEQARKMGALVRKMENELLATAIRDWGKAFHVFKIFAKCRLIREMQRIGNLRHR